MAVAEFDTSPRLSAGGKLFKVTEVVHERRRVWQIVTVAVMGGLLLGAVDLLAQRTLPYPWANLANSSAVWACGAYGIGAWVGAGRWRPAIAGVVLLLVAVQAYYLTATLVQNDDVSNMWTPVTLMWLLFGVLAGAVFGTAGAWSCGQHRWLRVVGAALPTAVLLAEAGVLASRSGDMDAAYRADSLQTAAIEVMLGVALVLVSGRSAQQRLGSLAASVPLALVGFSGFILAGFGG